MTEDNPGFWSAWPRHVRPWKASYLLRLCSELIRGNHQLCQLKLTKQIGNECTVHLWLLCVLVHDVVSAMLLEFVVQAAFFKNRSIKVS